MSSVRFALLVLAAAWVAPPAAFALEPEADPGTIFESLLAEGASLDRARDLVADAFDLAVATDLAVDLCAPPALEDCRGSEVLAAWGAFLDGIDEGGTASEVAVTLIESLDFDSHLAIGLAVYWCAPEPFEGCEEDPIAEAWSIFNSLLDEDPNPADAISQLAAQEDSVVAELIAAFECGESSCWADELAGVDLLELADLEAPAPAARQRPTSALQFGFKASKKKPDVLAKLCQSAAARAKIDRCKDL